MCVSQNEESYMFGITWGWVNDDSFIFLGELSYKYHFQKMWIRLYLLRAQGISYNVV